MLEYQESWCSAHLPAANHSITTADAHAGTAVELGCGAPELAGFDPFDEVRHHRRNHHLHLHDHKM